MRLAYGIRLQVPLRPIPSRETGTSVHCRRPCRRCPGARPDARSERPRVLLRRPRRGRRRAPDRHSAGSGRHPRAARRHRVRGTSRAPWAMAPLLNSATPLLPSALSPASAWQELSHRWRSALGQIQRRYGPLSKRLSLTATLIRDRTKSGVRWGCLAYHGGLALPTRASAEVSTVALTYDYYARRLATNSSPAFLLMGLVAGLVASNGARGSAASRGNRRRDPYRNHRHCAKNLRKTFRTFR